MRFVWGAALLAASFAMTGAGGAADSGSKADRDAAVTAVRADKSGSTYDFTVTIRSNDTGCDHYVDWWEVVGEDGKLIYRRVLLHDHADEQPFTRDGGPVAIDASRTVIVRAHVNTSGYSGRAMKGSPNDGFKSVTLPSGFASDLAKQGPQPPPC